MKGNDGTTQPQKNESMIIDDSFDEFPDEAWWEQQLDTMSDLESRLSKVDIQKTRVPEDITMTDVQQNGQFTDPGHPVWYQPNPPEVESSGHGTSVSHGTDSLRERPPHSVKFQSKEMDEWVHNYVKVISIE